LAVRYIYRAVMSVPRLAAHLQAAAAQFPQDIVLDAHDFVSAYICHRRFGHRYPLVLTVHAKGSGVREMLLDHTALGRTPIARLAYHIELQAVRAADIVVFPSLGARRLFEEAHPALLIGKDVRIVYTGIDVAGLRAVPEPPDLLGRYRIRPRQTLLLSVAAMVYDKGLDTLVSALARVPSDLRDSIHAMIVAREGPLKATLMELITRGGLNGTVDIVGYIPYEDLVHLMRRADLFVLPSRAAVFDLALLEAAAVGAPIVTTAVGGNLEMFDHDSALLIPPDDPESLAKAIADSLSDPVSRKSMAERGARRVEENFSLDRMMSTYLDLYREARLWRSTTSP